MLLGTDVSEWQQHPDWAAAAASGVVFAIARVSYGANHIDSSYAYNRAAIPAAGIIPGAYHFLTPGSDAAGQCDVFCQQADPGAVHALDVERGGLDVEGWVTRYRVHYPDHPLVVYTGRDLWRAAVGELNGSLAGPLWMAGYQPNAYVPGSGTLAGQWAKVGSAAGGLPWGGWSTAVFCQFTDTARVPGISSEVDGDVFYGTVEDLQQLTGVDMPLSGTDLASIKQIVADSIKAALPAIADEVENRYQVHVGAGLQATTEVLGEILNIVTGLTPAAVVKAVQLGQANMNPGR
jgi:lysozyme